MRAAFPDNTVLHPKWMEDFRDHVWEWGYRYFNCDSSLSCLPTSQNKPSDAAQFSLTETQHASTRLRHSAGAEEGARDEGCAYDSVTAVRVLRGGKTEYRCSREDAGDAWIEIDSSTSRAMHRQFRISSSESLFAPSFVTISLWIMSNCAPSFCVVRVLRTV